MFKALFRIISNWLIKEEPNNGPPLCDFERIRYEIRPCDVLLIEGRSRVSEVIKIITQSAWSHACMYIGRIHDIDDPALRQRVIDAYKGEPNEQLIIEGMLGKGTIISPLSTYQGDHIRICRPRGISRKDAQQVIATSIHKLGSGYDLRQLFDLLRFFFPWRIMPRHWRSSLFNKNIGDSTRAVCSTVIAESFYTVKFPILPLIALNNANKVELIHRNPRLFTPRDFDYSPFFEIIKYPFIEVVERGIYQDLPWNENFTNDGINIIDPSTQSESMINLLSKLKRVPFHKKKIEPTKPSEEPKDTPPDDIN